VWVCARFAVNARQPSHNHRDQLLGVWRSPSHSAVTARPPATQPTTSPDSASLSLRASCVQCSSFLLLVRGKAGSVVSLAIRGGHVFFFSGCSVTSVVSEVVSRTTSLTHHFLPCVSPICVLESFGGGVLRLDCLCARVPGCVCVAGSQSTCSPFVVGALVPCNAPLRASGCDPALVFVLSKQTCLLEGKAGGRWVRNAFFFVVGSLILLSAADNNGDTSTSALAVEKLCAQEAPAHRLLCRGFLALAALHPAGLGSLAPRSGGR
jgi:hypothetical protein